MRRSSAPAVGYGDAVPKTEVGRAVSVLLVLAMVIFFVPMVTASFASKLIVNRDAFTHEEQEEIKRNLAKVLERLRDSYEPLGRDVAPGDAAMSTVAALPRRIE